MSSLNDSADALRDRFIEEQEYVRKYVRLVRRQTSIDRLAIRRIADSLERHSLVKADELLIRRYGRGYSIDELREINARLQKLKPSVQTALEKAEAEFELIDNPFPFISEGVKSLVSECIDYLSSVLSYDSPSNVIEAQREKLTQHLRDQELIEENVVFIGDDFGSYEHLVDYAVKRTIYLEYERRVDDLYIALSSIEDTDIKFRAARNDTEINVLRQGFITLTTIFDATVFDLTRVALRRDFFNLIALFGKQDKISLERISKYSNLEELRDEIIEEQLRSKYLKEILFILRANGLTLTDTSAGDEFIHLLEMVLRRNIHIHNRGIVDSKYLEPSESGVPRYNIYNLTAGAVAHIDPAYWERANRVSLNCIRRIADWTNTLPLN